MSSHETKLRVRYAETDQMGVVYHSHFAVYFESARAEMIRDRGITYSDMEKQGIMMPVTELSIRYHRSATYDELLMIRTTVKEVPDKRITLYQDVFNEAGDQLVSGIVTLAFIDASTRRPVRAPDFFIALFSEIPSKG